MNSALILDVADKLWAAASIFNLSILGGMRFRSCRCVDFDLAGERRRLELERARLSEDDQVGRAR